MSMPRDEGATSSCQHQSLIADDFDQLSIRSNSEAVAGTNAPDQATTTTSSAAATACLSSTDILGLILGWLDIPETALCQRVNLAWKSAPLKEAPKQQEFVVHNVATASALKLPLVQRHTTDLIIDDSGYHRPNIWEALPELEQLFSGMTRMTRLEIIGESTSISRQPNRTLNIDPCAALRELHLYKIRPSVPLCLGIKRLELQTLTWKRRYVDDWMSFAIPFEIELPELEALCTPPHRLQNLESFCVCPSSWEPLETAPYTISRRHLELLLQLGPNAVTSLTPSAGFESDAIELLPQFQFLQTIELQSMVLSQAALTAVANIPSLSSLGLANCRCSDGLAALCNAVSSELELSLLHCNRITFADLQQLQGCKSLHSLVIKLRCDEDDYHSGDLPDGWLTAKEEAELEVPSKLIPSLKRFSFKKDINRERNTYGGGDDDYNY